MGVAPDLRIEYVSLDTLRPFKANARAHPHSQITQIAASIKEFGFVNPILVDEAGEIIAGHGRYAAAKSLGLAEIPSIRLSDLTSAQKRMLRIADNKIALGAAWDIDLLRCELADLGSLGCEIDLGLTGFAAGELDVILHPSTLEQEPAPPLPARPVSRRGDIWRLGQHKVGCGDARDHEFLRRVVGECRADAAFLDPPYNVKIRGHAGGKGKLVHREFVEASGEMSNGEFVAYLRETLGACIAVSRDGAVHFVCMDHGHFDQLLAVGAAIYGARLNIAVWNKSNAGMGSLYRSKHELIPVFRVGEAPHFNAVQLGKHGRNRTNVWDYASVNSFGGSRRFDLAMHPTAKPVQMVADAVMDVTRRGDVVLDAFLGSGTTLIAAERIGRVFRGLDLDPAYVDVALERWRAVTGEDPIHVETQRLFAAEREHRSQQQRTPK
jgi:DNA modification methylase